MNHIELALEQTRAFLEQHPHSRALILIQVQLRYLSKVKAGQRADRRRINRINLQSMAEGMSEIATPAFLASLKEAQHFANQLHARLSQPLPPPRHRKESYYLH